MESESRGVKRESRRLIGPVGAPTGEKKRGKKAVEETDGGAAGHKCEQSVVKVMFLLSNLSRSLTLEL